MDDKERLTIATSLKKLTKLVEANVATTGEAFEAEERSKNNELIAVELLQFGEFVADVAHMSQVEKDHVEQMFEHMKLELMNTAPAIDDKGQIVGMSSGMPANKAESTVKTDLSYIAALSALRDIQKSAEVLKRKQRSLESILDQSRSRLSLVSKGLPS